ncbi:SAFB-like transcription modulator isoform 2-T2 [Xenentodon cancila]
MASGAISADCKRISELRVVDLKSELRRRNLDTTGVKNVLIARLKQAIEDEGGDPENFQIQLPSDTTTRKSGKSKGKKIESDVDTTAEEDTFSKENEEYESEKDVTDTDDGTREKSKPPPCEDSLAYSEAEPESEAVAAEADSEPEPEVDAEADEEADLDAETEEAEMDAEAMSSSKEAEDDHLSVSIPNEDAITLDVDGDDLLETGKHVKLPDSEGEKGTGEPETSAEMDPDDDMKDEELEGQKDGKKDESRGDPMKKDSRDALKKAETGDKEKDSGKKGPSTTGASGRAKSSSSDRDGKAAKDEKAVGSNSFSRNLWVSGLSSNTKAADLKNLFGKYGKVLSAKVVTNARSPGSKCYGLVTMSSSTEVARCITHLDCTELHGQQIYVERAKNDPFKKEPSKKEMEEKAGSSKLTDKRTSTGTKLTNKTQPSHKKEERKSDKMSEKDKDLTKKLEAKGRKSESVSSNSEQESSKRDDRKHGRSKSPAKMMFTHAKRQFNFVKTRPFRRGRYFEKPFFNPNFQRRPKWLIPPEELEMIREKQRPFPNKVEDGDILPFEKMKEQKEQRMRERMARLERVRRAVELRRKREMAEQERRERERVRLLREREEREHLLRERQRLEMERQKLERERLERERLERERIRIEQERRKEAERMAREREELRRQQEHLRFEQEKRNTLKRGREVENGRRDDPYWNGNKKMQSASDVRLNQGSNFNRQQNRFSNFNSRERGRFPDAADQQPNTYDRRNRFDGEPEVKKSRLAPHREGSGFDRYPKNFDTVRRAEAPPPRSDVRDTDRRDRDDRRPGPMHDRPLGARGTMPTMSHGRTQRDGGHGWKNDGGINSNKGDIRGAMRMRSERPGRDGPGHVLRGGTSVNRGRSSFNDRDERRTMVMNDQPFTSGRQVVVQRHSRDEGLRKDWHGGSSSQGGGFPDNRRLGDTRGGMMATSHSSSGMSRIVQITNNSIPSGSSVGGFKTFKGTPRPF